MFWMKISATNSTTPDDRDRRVLAVQVGAGALLDGQRDALHLLVARREREQGSRGHAGRRPRRRRRIRGRRRPHGSSESCSTEILRGLIGVPREDVARTFLARHALARRALARRKRAAQSIVPASGSAGSRQRSTAPWLRGIHGRRLGVAQRPGTHSLPLDSAGPGPSGGSSAGRRAAAWPRGARWRRAWRSARPAPLGRAARRARRPRARRPSAAGRARRAAGAAPAGLRALEDRQQRAHAVDRVAHLLEVARLAPPAGLACAESPSRCPPMFSSDTPPAGSCRRS